MPGRKKLPEDYFIYFLVATGFLNAIFTLLALLFQTDHDLLRSLGFDAVWLIIFLMVSHFDRKDN